MMEDSKEIVYILTNPSMPGYVKIGRTSNLEARIRSLDTTSVPLPFECAFAAIVNDSAFVEKKLHDAFGDHRVRSNREFFEIAPERVIAALQLATIKEVTPQRNFTESKEDEAALEKAIERRSAFNFEMVKIPAGSLLTFSRDQNVTCTVIDDKYVDFQNEAMSLSNAALIALRNRGYNWKQVQGPQYWEYEGETLDERRKRMEENA